MKYLFALTLAFSPNAFAEGIETYNFYFQKAPGPTTVNQGTAPSPLTLGPDGQVVLPSAPPALPTSVAAASPEIQEEAKRHSLIMSLGFYQTGNGQGYSRGKAATGEEQTLKDKQYRIALEYGLFDRLALFAEGNFGTQARTALSTIYKDGDAVPGYPREIEGKKLIDTSVGAILDFMKDGSARTATSALGLVGGISSYHTLQYTGTGQSAYFPWNPDDRKNVPILQTYGYKMKFTPMGGLRARVMLFDRAGLEVSARYLVAPKTTALQGSVAYAF